MLQARLQQYVNRELPDVQAGVKEKAEEPEVKLPISIGSSKKQENSRKNIDFFIDYAKAFDCVDQNKLWKILIEVGIFTRPLDLPLEKPVCRSGSNG